MGSDMGNRIRSFRREKSLTQGQLAKLLGTAQTTIANYEQGIRVPDAEKLARLADVFGITMDELLGRSTALIARTTENPKQLRQPEQIRLEFLELLLFRDSASARKLILEQYEAGLSLEQVYFQIFVKTLQQVGTLWENGTVDIWMEHVISEQVLELMAELKYHEKTQALARIQVQKKAALVMLTPSAELHNIGPRMISDLLTIEGYRVIYLGSAIPMNSLTALIEAEKPDFIGISVALPMHMDSTALMIEGIKRRFGKKSPAILIGGQAFASAGSSVSPSTLGADYFASDLSQIRAVLNKSSGSQCDRARSIHIVGAKPTG